MSDTSASPVPIDKGVPIPFNAGRGGRGKYPWRQMVVGDSFYTTSGGLSALSSTCTKMGVQLGAKFVARKDGHGVRVWRIA